VKRLIFLFGALLIASLNLTGCDGSGNGTNENIQSSNDMNEESYVDDAEDQGTFYDESNDQGAYWEESEDKEYSKDCDRVLKEYKSFMDKYIAVLKKQQSNPGDMSIVKEYSVLSGEAQEWSSKTADCASDPSFASKFAEIQMQISNAVSGI